MTDETKGSRSGSDRTAPPPSQPTTPPKPVCRLIGTDGNVFSIIGRVRDALRKAGQDERAREFVEKAF